MTTHISKIGRLPPKIREELNRRLHHGELGRKILPWLNSLPETKQVLDDLFAGKSITHQNLSEWRHGGYHEWLLHQQRLEWFDRLNEQEDELKQHDDRHDTYEAFGRLLIVEIGQAFAALQNIKNPDARWERLQNLTREFARLQNSYNWSRHITLNWEKYNDQFEPSPPEPEPEREEEPVCEPLADPSPQSRRLVSSKPCVDGSATHHSSLPSGSTPASGVERRAPASLAASEIADHPSAPLQPEPPLEPPSPVTELSTLNTKSPQPSAPLATCHSSLPSGSTPASGVERRAPASLAASEIADNPSAPLQPEPRLESPSPVTELSTLNTKSPQPSAPLATCHSSLPSGSTPASGVERRVPASLAASEIADHPSAPLQPEPPLEPPADSSLVTHNSSLPLSFQAIPAYSPPTPAPAANSPLITHHSSPPKPRTPRPPIRGRRFVCVEG